jgi:hypothetical protein
VGLGVVHYPLQITVEASLTPEPEGNIECVGIGFLEAFQFSWNDSPPAFVRSPGKRPRPSGPINICCLSSMLDHIPEIQQRRLNPRQLPSLELLIVDKPRSTRVEGAGIVMK